MKYIFLAIIFDDLGCNADLYAFAQGASWIDCFSLNNDIVWNRVFLIIRYVQNTLKDIYIKCYNETYKRITYVHFDDI